MKKLFPASFRIVSSLFAKTQRQKAYRWMAVVFLAGCTATQTRWDATNIRKEVMVYYNDQIMENLIRAKNHLPFVHVDITLLTSQGSSQISGTIGYGETITNTSTGARTNQITTTDARSTSPTGPGTMHMVAAIAGGLVATATHAAMRPFTYSVTPQQNETLSIQAAPALGSQAIASMSQTMIPTKKTEETWGTEKSGADNTAETEKPGADNTAETQKPGTDNTTDTGKTWTKVTTEKAPRPTTIYERYEEFAECYVQNRPTPPSKGEYVPDTLKRWRGEYYYIPAGNWKCRNWKCRACRKHTDKDKEDNQMAYYEFCKELFIKGQSQTGGLERALQQTQAAAALPIR